MSRKAVRKAVKVESLAARGRYSLVGGPFGSKLTSSDYVEEGIPVIRGSNLNGSRHLDETEFVFVSEQKMREDLFGNLAHRGDVVFTQRGTLGQTALIPVDARFDTYVISQSQMKLTVDPKKADPRYLYYYFSSREAVQKILNQNSSSGVPHINLTTLRNFLVPQVPLHEQRKIADTLYAYDDLIENNRRRIALLEKAARLIYREWFVHLRFPGHEHVKITDGLPEGWGLRKLGDIAETNKESYQAKELPDEINYIDISSVAQGRVVSKTRIPAREAPGRARRRIRNGDTIWSNVRPNLRAYALMLEPEELDVVSTGFTVLTATRVPYTWLYIFVTTDNFVGHLVNHATGAGYPAVRPHDFERAALPLPPRELLDQFHEAAEPNFRLACKLDQQNQKLAQARDLLLPRLMNGEIAV